MLFISSIASGSNGNCYYIGDQDDAILVDAGISCREVEKRMKRLELDIKRVRAIFISHEHTDHINGMKTISRKHQLPVYITKPTLRNSYSKIEKHLICSFKEMEPVVIGNLTVTAFKKSHDALDPHSFIVSGHKVNVGVFTDIGYACEPLINYFRQCHAAFLECNYCEDMLMNGSYPIHLKKRISSKKGHLSNNQALELFMKYGNKHLSHLILSHLSKNNNDPELVNKLFNEKAGPTKIVVASRYEETPVFSIEPTARFFGLTHPRIKMEQTQLSLFASE